MNEASPSPPADSEEFSLMLGGPLYQFFRQSQLLRPPLQLLHRRLAVLMAITWLPLLGLSFLSGTVWSEIKVPFIYDLDVHCRLLVALPLLVWAECVVHSWIAGTVRQFTDQDLIAPEDRPQFQNAISTALQLRNSVPVELVMLLVAFIGGHRLWDLYVGVQADTWYGSDSGSGKHLTIAGNWYAFVSLPIFRFLLMRWYFRLAIWFGFLWRVSRLPLRLNALHPDRAGGLGFLGDSVIAFVPVYLAHTVLLAGSIADHIWHERTSLPDYKLEIAGLLVFLLLLMLFPLFFFVKKLGRARREGRREYSARASNYVNEFRRKWLEDRDSPREDFLGSADIQSLSDLGQSYNVVREMQLVPITRREILMVIMLIVVPLLPLLLTMAPLSELLNRMMKFIL